MPEELVKVKRFAGAALAVVRMCQAVLGNMLYPSFYGNLTAASEPKLERPRVQGNLADLLSDQKLQIISGGKAYIPTECPASEASATPTCVSQRLN